mmetsp:Transcript_930/g.2641  ORF Transcript_930/g.2641 Transcript_930/m.2641 type:complete len:132 (-) Transcript_930:60-455(-)
MAPIPGSRSSLEEMAVDFNMVVVNHDAGLGVCNALALVACGGANPCVKGRLQRANNANPAKFNMCVVGLWLASGKRERQRLDTVRDVMASTTSTSALLLQERCLLFVVCLEILPSDGEKEDNTLSIGGQAY